MTFTNIHITIEHERLNPNEPFYFWTDNENTGEIYLKLGGSQPRKMLKRDNTPFLAGELPVKRYHTAHYSKERDAYICKTA